MYWAGTWPHALADGTKKKRSIERFLTQERWRPWLFRFLESGDREGHWLPSLCVRNLISLQPCPFYVYFSNFYKKFILVVFVHRVHVVQILWTRKWSKTAVPMVISCFPHLLTAWIYYIHNFPSRIASDPSAPTFLQFCSLIHVAACARSLPLSSLHVHTSVMFLFTLCFGCFHFSYWTNHRHF